MAKRTKRLSPWAWHPLRKQVYERDEGICQYPYGKHEVGYEEFHCDHIVPLSRGGNNKIDNLRVLCAMHHVLREDAHQQMIAWALKNEIIPPDWRSLVWNG